MEHIKPPERVLSQFPDCPVVDFLPPDEVGICDTAYILKTQEQNGPWDGMTILRAYFKLSDEEKEYILNSEDPFIELSFWGSSLPPFAVNLV